LAALIQIALRGAPPWFSNDEMRGQILLVALLSAATGHSALPPPPPGAPSPPPVLAPSPYVPALAPDPFASPATSPRPEALTASARQRPRARALALLAPSPYDLDLAPNPYAGLSRSGLTAATAPVTVGESAQPPVLAPSPYEPQHPSDLAPYPY